MQLENMDREVKMFMWSGKEDNRKPRVNYETICKPKAKGRLEVISIKSQTLAQVGKTILWAGQEGEQTLQCII